MRLSFKKTSDGILKRLDGMVSRSKDVRVVLNRTIYKMYQEAQIKRWDTENTSEGRRWTRLSEPYRLRKLKKYANYPYGGTRILIATGTLLQSVVGGSQKYHRKIVRRDGLTIHTTVPYAPDVAEKRPFMEFSRKTTASWQREILKYLKG